MWSSVELCTTRYVLRLCFLSARLEFSSHRTISWYWIRRLLHIRYLNEDFNCDALFLNVQYSYCGNNVLYRIKYLFIVNPKWIWNFYTYWHGFSQDVMTPWFPNRRFANKMRTFVCFKYICNIFIHVWIYYVQIYIKWLKFSCYKGFLRDVCCDLNGKHNHICTYHQV